MLTGELRSQIDAIWNAFWSGGISNPIEVIEQITYLLFIRRLDDAHTLEENKATVLKKPMVNRVFPAGKDSRGRNYNDLVEEKVWSRLGAGSSAYMTVDRTGFAMASGGLAITLRDEQAAPATEAAAEVPEAS